MWFFFFFISDKLYFLSVCQCFWWHFPSFLFISFLFAVASTGLLSRLNFYPNSCLNIVFLLVEVKKRHKEDNCSSFHTHNELTIGGFTPFLVINIYSSVFVDLRPFSHQPGVIQAKDLRLSTKNKNHSYHIVVESSLSPILDLKKNKFRNSIKSKTVFSPIGNYLTVLLNQYDSYSRNTEEIQKNPFRTFKRCCLKTGMHCRALISAPTLLEWLYLPLRGRIVSFKDRNTESWKYCFLFDLWWKQNSPSLFF